MRRKEKQVTGRRAIDAVIRASSVCRLAMSHEDRPYVVPLCFGYDGGTLYFHSALEGKKALDLIMKQYSGDGFEYDERPLESCRSPAVRM